MKSRVGVDIRRVQAQSGNPVQPAGPDLWPNRAKNWCAVSLVRVNGRLYTDWTLSS